MLANGWDGYLPPPEQMAMGGYTTWLARSSCLEAEAEPKIRARVMQLLETAAGGYRRAEARPAPPAYAAAVQAGRVPPRAAEDELDAAADALERFVFGVRLGEGISPAAAARAWPALATRVADWEARFARLASQGIVESVPVGADPRWRLTTRGREVADAVIRELL